MKPKINLRLCVAGSDYYLEQFKKCLNSYLQYYEIGELYIYTTENLFNEVDAITAIGKADQVSIYDIDQFYKEHKKEFSQDVTVVLSTYEDCSGLLFNRRKKTIYPFRHRYNYVS